MKSFQTRDALGISGSKGYDDKAGISRGGARVRDGLDKLAAGVKSIRLSGSTIDS